MRRRTIKEGGEEGEEEEEEEEEIFRCPMFFFLNSCGFRVG